MIVKGGKPESMLSPLEQDILGVLWSKPRMRVRDIHAILRKNKKVALSSIGVILDRLHEKGVVSRDIEKARGGVRYIYFPTTDKQTFEKTAIDTVVNKLIAQFGTNAVSYFNERFGRKP